MQAVRELDHDDRTLPRGAQKPPYHCSTGFTADFPEHHLHVPRLAQRLLGAKAEITLKGRMGQWSSLMPRPSRIAGDRWEM